jgi:hypothetical protein
MLVQVYVWGVIEKSAGPQNMVEWFMVESWAEHLRQHRRLSNADADLQGELLTYHRGPDKPGVAISWRSTGRAKHDPRPSLGGTGRIESLR